MNSDQASKMRRRSMLGTVLLVLGIIAAIAFAATSALWLIGVAVALVALAVVMLYQVGKSLS